MPGETVIFFKLPRINGFTPIVVTDAGTLKETRAVLLNAPVPIVVKEFSGKEISASAVQPLKALLLIILTPSLITAFFKFLHQLNADAFISSVFPGISMLLKTEHI